MKIWQSEPRWPLPWMGHAFPFRKGDVRVACSVVSTCNVLSRSTKRSFVEKAASKRCSHRGGF